MDKLTKKQQGFVKDYIATGNGTQSALNNYDIESDKPEKVASVIATENLAKPSIQNAIKSIAESIPDELIIEKHLALLNKQEVLIKTIDGETKVIPTGEIDVQAVKAGLDMTYKLRGLYAPDKSINLNVEANITDPKARELAQRYEDELKKTL